MARTDTLTNYLTDVATAIKTKKGDNTPIQASSFDTEIANLPSGGGSVDTLAKLNKKANEFFEYALNKPNSYSSSTSEQTTLYTPNENYKSYVIIKKSNGYYRVLWLKSYYGIGLLNYSSEMTSPRPLCPNLVSLTDYSFENLENIINIIKMGVLLDGYETTDETTLSSCLNTIKNSQTSYTKISAYHYLPKGEEIIYSNTFVYDEENDIFLDLQKISSNETIQVIQ